MPLVEVVRGHLTAPKAAARVEAASIEWKKTPVRCKAPPGFIANRVARPYYGEAFRALESGAADVATIDLALREAGGFKLGAFELLDLIGLDVNLMVTKSVWKPYYQDSRYRPSLTQEEMVSGGLFGRKSGRGFYKYPEGVPTTTRFARRSEARRDSVPDRIRGDGAVD